MNTVILMGRLTKDPEVMYTNGETAMAIARYTLAVDRRFKRDGQPEADFFECSAFGRAGEFAEKYFHRGTKIVIQGRLQNDNYKGKDGKMVYRNVIMVESQEFAESKGAKSETKEKAKPEPDDDGFMIPDGVEEELPFE